MNYYIQGSPARAKEIKATFEKLGYGTRDFNYSCGLFVTCNSDRYVHFLSSNNQIIDIIKTHPDYKELELPVQHKFKVGDLLVYENGSCFAGGFRESRVVKVDGVYYFSTGTTGSFKFIDENCRLWSIQDAIDGDVLVTEDYIFIFKYILHGGVHLYCHYNIDDEEFDSDIPDAIIGNIHDKGAHFRPVTKEQRDLLFQKMKEAGYKWDAKKKELRKIKPHYDISNFHAGMPVLVRDYIDEEWHYVQFSHMRKLTHALVFDAGCSDWYQCVPYNDDTKHLLGTTDMCDERFINW